MSGVVRFFGTWLIVLIVLIALSKTRWGAPIVYGLLWLAVLLLVVTHAEELTSFFSLEALQLNG